MHEATALHEIAIAYFKLDHIPIKIKIVDILCPVDVYFDKDMTDVSFKFLKELISNTNKYIGLCNNDGGYLFRVDLDGYEILMHADVKLNKNKVL